MYKKNLKINKISIFYIAWIMMVINICIANSDLEVNNTSIISYIALVLFGIKIIIQKKYKFCEIFLLIVLILCGYIASKSADDMRVLWFVIVIVASKDIDFDKTVRYTFFTMFSCCIIFFLSYLFGITEETVMYTSRGIRHSLGLGHPNMCSAYYTILISLNIYLKFDYLRIRNVFSYLLGTFILYYFTKSITGLIITLLVLIIMFVLRFVSLKKINSKVILLILLVGIFVFTILPIVYNSSFFLLDKLMTGRLRQANFYYVKYGISLFGNNINSDLTNIYTDNILDMGYAKMLINNGIFYYLFVVFGYLISMFKAVKHSKSNLIALISCFIIYMFTENVATYIFMNVTMLLFSNILYKNNIKN